MTATATSIDGRSFVFRSPIAGLELQPGSYASLAEYLGQVHEVALAPADPASVEGHGMLLDEGVAPFHDVPIAAAGETLVRTWLEGSRPKRAALDVGDLVSQPDLRLLLDAGGFNRHTFFCGQSGSGKSYALGAVLEQLLLETSLRIVVLDPNSDFVRVGSLREGVDGEVASRYRRAAEGVVVRRGGTADGDRLHVRFTDFDAEEQAAVLRLDPIRDREEYGVLVDLVEQGLETEASSANEVADRLLQAAVPEQRALGTRLRNLGIHRWPIWSTGDEGSIQDLVASGGPRGLVVDLGSLETPGEKAIAAESVLAALWRRRAERDPMLVVIDEAHNVCPREPGDEVTALATEHATRIATEGRKFGLYLLVSTQRPQRVHELVVSQCDNLVLMRMSSGGDRDYLAETLSFAPAALVDRARIFRPGEALVAGKIASHPAFVRFGPRIAEEGGGDVPSAWAESP